MCLQTVINYLYCYSTPWWLLLSLYMPKGLLSSQAFVSLLELIVSYPEHTETKRCELFCQKQQMCFALRKQWRLQHRQLLGQQLIDHLFLQTILLHAICMKILVNTLLVLLQTFVRLWSTTQYLRPSLFAMDFINILGICLLDWMRW